MACEKVRVNSDCAGAKRVCGIVPRAQVVRGRVGGQCWRCPERLDHREPWKLG